MGNTKNKNNIIALVQSDLISGDIEHNKNSLIKNLTKESANLFITSQGYLLGGIFGNILNRFPHLFNQINYAINEIKTYTKNSCIFLGNIEKDYTNSIIIIKNCEIIKTIKENDNIENKIFELENVKYGFIFNNEEISKIAPLCDVLINNQINPSKCRKDKKWLDFIQNTAKKYSKKLLYVNQAGAIDEFIFRGLSCAVDEFGKIAGLAKEFSEDLLILNDFKGDIKTILEEIEFNHIEENFSLDYEYDLKRTYQAIICAIKGYFSKNNIKRATLGLSGGLDSTICAVLLADALGCENVYGVFMPSKLTSDESQNDAFELAKNLKINYIEAPIKTMHNAISKEFSEIFSNITWDGRYEKSYTQDNIQARLRAMILWGISNEYSSCTPIATSDKSEIYMGYATINGDMSGGFAPISDVCKTKLFALGRWMNKNREAKNVIPENILMKPPGAELAIDEKTGKTLKAEDALMPYEFMDEIIFRIENFNQTKENMKNIKFLYEKKHEISAIIKNAWLDKFFSRYNSACYKWYISAPSPLIDTNSINKAVFKQPITSNIKY